MSESPQPLKQIRTFQGDVAEALSSQHESLYSIQAKERARQGPILPKPERSLLFFVGGVLLLAVAGVGGWYTYSEFITKTTPPPVAVPQSRLISSEESVEVDVNGLSREGFIQAVMDVPLGARADQVTHLVLRSGTSTAALMTTPALFATLNASAPGSFVRALDPAFMLGSYGESYFLIFKLSSYPNAFAGMLAWEPTLASDLGTLISPAVDLKSIAPDNVFKDTVYRNKDARTLFVGETPALLYSFLNQEYLIITDSPDTLQALIDRLTREKLAR